MALLPSRHSLADRLAWRIVGSGWETAMRTKRDGRTRSRPATTADVRPETVARYRDGIRRRLRARGVPEDQLDARVAEVMAADVDVRLDWDSIDNGKD
jgi:hypothetical protein